MSRTFIFTLLIMLAMPTPVWAQGSVNEDPAVQRQKNEQYNRDQQQLYEQQQRQAQHSGYEDQSYSKPSGPKWVDSYGTAVWRTDGEHGFGGATNFTSQKAADKAALKLCSEAGFKCEVARRVANGMILGVRDANGLQWIASAPNLPDAKELVDERCAKIAVECYVTAVYESQPWQDSWGDAKDAISLHGPWPDSYAASAWVADPDPELKWHGKLWIGSKYGKAEDARSFAIRECEAASQKKCTIAAEVKNGFIISHIDSANSVRVSCGPNFNILKQNQLNNCTTANVTCGTLTVTDSIKD